MAKTAKAEKIDNSAGSIDILVFSNDFPQWLSLLPSPDSCDLSFELQKISEEGTLDVLIYT